MNEPKASLFELGSIAIIHERECKISFDNELYNE